MFNVSLEEMQKCKEKVIKAMEPLTQIGVVYTREITAFKQEVEKHKADRITQTVLNEAEELAKTTIKETQKTMLNDALSSLRAIKEEYLSLCKQGKTTTDPVDIAITEKELRAMDEEELIQFYKDNIGDTNKLRLFNLELKEREKSQEGITAVVKARLELEVKKDSVMRLIEMIESDLNRYIDMCKTYIFTGIMVVKDHPSQQTQYLNMGDFNPDKVIFDTAKNEVYYNTRTL